MSTDVISLSSRTQDPLLLNYLRNVVNVDFATKAGLDEILGEKKLTHKDFIVCVVDELLEIAESNNWGICKLNGSMYAYNGTYWQLLDVDELKCFLGDVAWFMGMRRTEAKIYTFQEQLFSQFLASSRLVLPSHKRRSTLINLANGTFEISENGQTLREFRRKDALTYKLGFNYDTNATCPLFEEYLNRVIPDRVMQDILAEFLGYIFVKNLKLEKCLLLYGTGANGKSVLFEIVNALLGEENITNLSLGNLAEEHNRAMIANKLLNYGSEIRGNVDSDIFKALVSNEPIQCRRKYENPFVMREYAKLCFNCNELPKEVEHTEAFFRRFLIVPFNVTIPEDERNPDLANEIIAEELSGIFNWVIRGLQRILFHRNFSYSEEVKLAVAEYKKNSDSVQLFLEESSFIPHQSNFMLLKVLYPQYREFCLHDGYKPLNKTNFKRRLDNLGFAVERRNNGWVVFLGHIHK